MVGLNREVIEPNPVSLVGFPEFSAPSFIPAEELNICWVRST